MLPKESQGVELVFTDPSSIPATYRDGMPVDIAFTITNHTGQPLAYRYQIVEESSAQAAHQLVDAAAQLAPGESKQIAHQVAPMSGNDEVSIAVRSVSETERINVWLTKT